MVAPAFHAGGRTKADATTGEIKNSWISTHVCLVRRPVDRQGPGNSCSRANARMPFGVHPSRSPCRHSSRCRATLLVDRRRSRFDTRALPRAAVSRCSAPPRRESIADVHLSRHTARWSSRAEPCVFDERAGRGHIHDRRFVSEVTRARTIPCSRSGLDRLAVRVVYSGIHWALPWLETAVSCSSGLAVDATTSCAPLRPRM